jgi:SAM-dependent methyltransferase
MTNVHTPLSGSKTRVAVGWKTKAAIIRACSLLPEAERVYRIIQRRYGRLDGNPTDRFTIAARLAALINRFKPLDGSRMLEIGTGHAPRVPMAFYLCGAAQITTIDLNRRMDETAVRGLVDFVGTCDCVRILESAGIDSYSVTERARRVTKSLSVAETLQAAGIKYIAPGDARHTGLPGASFDCVFSVYTFEHIPRDVLAAIMTETRRLLAPGGIAVHLIDASDHFEHADKSISKSNFLRYGDFTWSLIANNSFAFCNRLRASDYALMFSEAGFTPLHWDVVVDSRSREEIISGKLRAHPQFRGSADDLATTEIMTVLAAKE